ncbi:hypothetical protein [Streptomyces sp. Inha503]|uniref:hypothetical protein n=1 Tax=Streptomyces sp. Inha503 TaxID=3383314 RepID=UPI00399FFEE7
MTDTSPTAEQPPQRGPVTHQAPHRPSTNPEGAATRDRAADGRTAVRLPGFIEVASYRHDHGHQAWAARCWGNGPCPGWLSVDHYSEESAQRWARHHLAEDHPDTTPDSRTDSPDTEPDSTVDTQTDNPTTSTDSVRTTPDACPDHPGAPTIGGRCGDCTIHPDDPAARRPPMDPVHILGIGAADGATAPDAEVRDSTLRYERTTGHSADCPAGFADVCVCGDGTDNGLREQYAAADAATWRGRAEFYETALARMRDRAEVAAVRAKRAEDERDQAYRERAHLLAWLSALHPANAVITTATDIDEPGWQLLYLLVSGWQMSWHIHPRDALLFTHVEQVEPTDPRAQWDGHSTKVKYQRILEHVARIAG